MIKLTKAEVEHLKAQRQARDLIVATQLWDLYEKEQRVGMMQCIRTLVGHGLDYLYELKWKDESWMTDFLNKECGGLDLWEGRYQTFDRFLKLREKGAGWWDIGKCGGFLRMYGTFFEVLGGELYDEGVDSFKTRTAKDPNTGEYTKLPFGKYKPPDKDKRKGGDVQTEQQYRKEHPRARIGRLKQHKGTVPGDVKGIVHRPYGDDPGITLFKLLAWSTIKKIDSFFGLPEGADISGTTSDHLFGIYHTLYLMEQRGSAPRSIKFPGGSYPADLQQINERKPLIILLPLVQMIREYHHSLLESAAALSLNDMIDYKIGFYSSLIASDYTRQYDSTTGKVSGYKVVPWRPTNMPIANTVRELLIEAEKAAPHMLCCSYMKKQTPDTDIVGYLMDKSNPKDVQKFRNFARIGVETYKDFYSLPTNITMTYVQNKMKGAGLEF